MTIDEALQNAVAVLSSSSDSARLDAEIILAHVFNQQRSYLRAHADDELSPADNQNYAALIARRRQGEPIAYLTGHKEFWSLDLRVNQDTLIPRPETELLIEAVLELFPDQTQCIKAADLGTGSGAIALALASERPHWEVSAVDMSDSALCTARDNAQRLRINNVSFYLGDWFTALPEREFDLVVSNPPYLSKEEWPAYADGLAFEPESALLSGEDGLDAIRQICRTAHQYIRPGGVLLVEHGFLQGQSVRDLFILVGCSGVQTIRDLSGQDRITIGRF
jgi:release factor glutamine methyltransferase